MKRLTLFKFFTFLLAFFLFNVTAFGVSPEQMSIYLSENQSDGADIIDTDKYDLFVSGESHATQINFDIQLEIIKTLSEKTDLKYILAEDSFANSLLINDYLHTGDVSKLDRVFQFLNHTMANSVEYYKYFKKLYEFNRTLPEDKKLTYIGWDVEHQYQNTFYLIKELALSKKNIPNVLKEFCDKCNIECCGTNSSKFQNALMLLNNVRDDLSSNINSYKNSFGEDFWNFSYLIQNLYNFAMYTTLRYQPDQGDGFRENAAIDNIKKIYEHYPKGKMFGQWGEEHTYLKSLKYKFKILNYKRLASALNNDESSPLHNKVCSMEIVYFNSYRMNAYGDPKVMNKAPYFSNNELDLLESKMDDKNLKFFKLDSEGSPFSKGLCFLKDNAPDGVDTDYFKYIIAVNGSQACHKKI